MFLKPDYLITNNLLCKDNIKTVHDIMDKSQSVHGENSFGGDATDIKSNNEFLLTDENVNQFMEILLGRMTSRKEFLRYVMPKGQITLPILSRMVKGDFYKPHQDHYTTGDYSTTVFLNDPKSYKGGELCLMVGGEEKKFKLRAGSSITYPTGTFHRVNTVTKGTRDVIVFWSHSEIKSPIDHEIVWGLNKLCDYFPDDNKNLETTYDAVESPSTILNHLVQLIMRNNVS